MRPVNCRSVSVSIWVRCGMPALGCPFIAVRTSVGVRTDRRCRGVEIGRSHRRGSRPGSQRPARLPTAGGADASRWRRSGDPSNTVSIVVRFMSVLVDSDRPASKPLLEDTHVDPPLLRITYTGYRVGISGKTNRNSAGWELADSRPLDDETRRFSIQATHNNAYTLLAENRDSCSIESDRTSRQIHRYGGDTP